MNYKDDTVYFGEQIEMSNENEFEYEVKVYVAAEPESQFTCNGCDFDDDHGDCLNSSPVSCYRKRRADKRSVIFKEKQ